MSLDNLDSKDIIKRAQELLDEGKESVPNQKEVEEKTEKSYDEENNQELDDTSSTHDKLENPHKDLMETPFSLPKQGYKRLIHFKAPSIVKFIAGIVVIGILIYIVSLMLPYIPPVLA